MATLAAILLAVGPWSGWEVQANGDNRRCRAGDLDWGLQRSKRPISRLHVRSGTGDSDRFPAAWGLEDALAASVAKAHGEVGCYHAKALVALLPHRDGLLARACGRAGLCGFPAWPETIR